MDTYKLQALFLLDIEAYMMVYQIKVSSSTCLLHIGSGSLEFEKKQIRTFLGCNVRDQFFRARLHVVHELFE